MRTVRIVAILALILTAVLFFRSCISPSVSRSRILTAVVERGSIDASLSASGTVVPEYEQVFTSPIRSTVLGVIKKSGDTVQVGESILLLDTEAAKFDVSQLESELDSHRNRKKQLLLQLERQSIELDASRDIKELEVQFAQTQFDRTNRLHELGGATDEDLAQARLNLDIGKRQLDQVGKSVTNQKASLEAEIEGLDLQIRMKADAVRKAERDLEQAQVRAERAGVVTWVNSAIGSFVNPGDIVAKVADLESFKIEAQISNIHATKLQSGGRVVVRIGDTELPGVISTVYPSVENGISRFDVRLDESNHPSLRPNLRADVFVLTSRKDDVLRVANGPFVQGRVDQKVFVIDGDVARSRTVDIGLSNYDYVELIGGVNVGDEVIISDMKQYKNAQEIKLTK